MVFKYILNKLRIRSLFDAIHLGRKAFGEYKKQIILLIILGFLGGLFEAVGINALIPLFSFFSGNSKIGGDVISNLIAKLFSIINVEFNLYAVLVFITILFFAKAVMLLLFDYIKVGIRTDYERKTRDKLFRNTLKANWPYLIKQKIGYLETVLNVDIKHSAGLLDSMSRSIIVISSLFMYLLVAINISETITLMTIGIGMVIFFVFKPILFKVRVLAHKIANMNKELARHVNETVVGMKVIKVIGADEDRSKIAYSFFDQLRSLERRTLLLSQFTAAFIQPISVLFISLIVVFSFKQTSYNLGALAAVIYLIQKIFAYVQNLQTLAQSISASVPYTQAVLSYMDMASEFKEQKENYGADKFIFNKSISLNNVNFAYEDSNTILNNINIKINKGEMVGLIGSSGAGKTTIFDLILRLFEPQDGGILIDDNDIKKISIKQWRENIGYVPQDAFLINDTILNNIKFHDESISDEMAIEAAKLAHVYDFTEKLPNKFETEVGERGALLSAGQRQRVAIARALARRPQILLFDEATSALDARSEKRIQDTINNLKGKTTVLVIAHRLSTILDSDKLFVLSNGKIIEEGTPKELLNNKDTYFYKMYNIRDND